MSTLPPRVLALMAWATVSFVWGTTYISNDLAIATIPPFRYASLRFLVAGLLVFPLARWMADDETSIWAIVRHPTARAGTFTLGIGVGANIWALQWLPSGIAAVLVAGVPLWMVLVERFVFDGARLRVPVLLGLALGIMGIGIITLEQGHTSTAQASLWAVAVVLGAGCSWAYGSVLIRHRTPPADLASTAGAQMLWAGLLQGGVSLLLGETTTEPVSLLSGGAALYTVVFGTCLAYIGYLYALRHLSVAFVSTYVFVNPVVALGLGWLVLGDPLTLQTLVGSAVILLGLALTRIRSSPRDAPTEPSQEVSAACDA